MLPVCVCVCPPREGPESIRLVVLKGRLPKPLSLTSLRKSP